MPDREKYIEILSKAVKTVKEFNEDTPIKISLECVEDILALLKDQQQQIWELQDQVEYLTDKLKEQDSETERLKKPTAGDNHIPLRW